MNIWVHPYRLRPRVLTAAPRLGALVKVRWSTSRVGYADLHPIPELGDEPLLKHLDRIARADYTPLVERAIQFAEVDADYRRQRRNAFRGLSLPRAHHLVMDLDELDGVDDLRARGFTHVKAKVGRDLDAETDILHRLVPDSGLRWRLDFNARVAAEDFEDWWQTLGDPVRDAIDFIEDPSDGELEIDGPWADDWVVQPRARACVVKPSHEDPEVGYRRVIFTHGLDHTLGQACALWSAARFYNAYPHFTEVGGLASADIYEPDQFSETWSNPGPRLKPTTGYGFGFDDILENLKWDGVL